MSPDLDKLSTPDLMKLLEETEAKLKYRKQEEIKVLADGYVKKCQMSGYTVQEAIDALKPYLPQRSNKTSDVKYRDPSNPDNVWSGRGKRPGWLRANLEQGRKLEEFAA